ncbi:SDR family oxidoreductase [Halobacillus litoralis]|uniref:SDR family oxidoreductase n=1 Tax=Halobacillus litoralis TaxID=45668 RepID=UPI001CD3B552|nr:SDR family oxidoreductase [Halobacillus litoralis]MCA0972806.1 SDR family oxidoreductase [Halobacillus litoralis]
MNVLVIGANGQVGRKIVQKLQQTEHEPVAMVRESDQAKAFKKMGVKTVIGDLEKDFEHAFIDMEAIIFAAGSGGHTGADKTILIDQEGAIKAMDRAKHFGIKRCIMLSTIGADRPDLGPDDFKYYLYAKHRADEYLKASGLSYSILRPGSLTDEEGTGKVKLQEHLNEFGEIPREDVAATLVALLTTEGTNGKSYDVISGEQPIEDALAN